MKPSRISFFLIILLLATNVFLILNIRAVEITKNILPEQMITDAVQLLERSGIVIDASVIPSQRPDSPIFEGGISDEELTAFAEGFSESKADGPFLRLEGGTFYSDGEYIFEFTGELGFSLYKRELKLSDDILQALDGDVPSVYDEKLAKKAKKEIKALFVRYPDAGEQSEVTGCVSLGDDGYVAAVRRLTQGLEVDGQEMRVYIKDGEIIAARGVWYFEEYKGKYSMPLMDSVNILFKARDLGEDFSGIIKEMKLHYNVIWHQIDKYYLIPSWKVSFVDGKELVFNALTGDLIS